jgi:hypothetical protein
MMQSGHPDPAGHGVRLQSGSSPVRNKHRVRLGLFARSARPGRVWLVPAKSRLHPSCRPLTFGPFPPSLSRSGEVVMPDSVSGLTSPRMSTTGGNNLGFR